MLRRKTGESEMAISVSLDGEIFEQVLYSIEDDFEQLVAENAETIFGDKAIYINAKRKINTSTLGRTIPDGFLIDLLDYEESRFYLVELELQNHNFFNHIFPQITKFFAFYKDSQQRHKLIETIFKLFQEDTVLKSKIRDLIGSEEVYKFLKDTIDNSQNILIIIDGSKPEFEEIVNTYNDTWGKMVKVQIVNHFRRGANNIITVEPPFQNLPFADAVSPSPEKETTKPSVYTEEFHLQNRQPGLAEIYNKLRQEFINVKNTLWFNPTQSYIGVGDKKQFAYIVFQKKKVRLILLLPEDETRGILQSKHHTVISHSESAQRYWGGREPNCAADIYDTDNWDEIQKLVGRLVEKHQET
jgi:predicted transport protein